jgi:hypothetical protein
MTDPSFEIDVCLRAARLVAHVPPAASLRTEEAAAEVVRDEIRHGVPDELRAGAVYREVVIGKRLTAEVRRRQ